MGEPIKEYKETRCCFPAQPGQAGSGEPAIGEMFVYLYAEVAEGVKYLCPCGCGHTVYTPVSMGSKVDGYWLFSRGPNGPTLEPSVRWLSGCKAHFNITDGKVVIHSDSGK